MRVEQLSHAALDRLMPMHLLVSETGHIIRAGPTAAKLVDGDGMVGKRLLEVLELHRPSGVHSIDMLRNLSGQKLHFRLRHRPGCGLKGIALPTGQGGSLIVNLSFGIGVLDAVHDFTLTSHDFAATDLAIEMLFLVEAKSAVLGELRQLNTRLQGAKKDAEIQAQTDTLTGLANRRAMDETLSLYIEKGMRFGLMHIDLDYFKTVNDTHGHAAGDHVLREVARLLRTQTRADDLVVRAGGDEFVILFPDLTDTGKLNDIALRIIADLEKPIEFEGIMCRISGSIGTTVSEFYAQADADRMLADADEALYLSKHAGRARATVYSVDATGNQSPRPH